MKWIKVSWLHPCFCGNSGILFKGCYSAFNVLHTERERERHKKRGRGQSCFSFDVLKTVYCIHLPNSSSKISLLWESFLLQNAEPISKCSDLWEIVRLKTGFPPPQFFLEVSVETTTLSNWNLQWCLHRVRNSQQRKIIQHPVESCIQLAYQYFL